MLEAPERRANLIQVVTSPLGFFALSLLIVEGFLTVVLSFSDLDANSKFIGMLIGAGLFLVVVLGVLVLVWKKPTNLTFGEKSHLQLLEMQKAWGTSDRPETKHEIENDETPAAPVATAATVIAPEPVTAHQDQHAA